MELRQRHPRTAWARWPVRQSAPPAVLRVHLCSRAVLSLLLTESAPLVRQHDSQRVEGRQWQAATAWANCQTLIGTASGPACASVVMRHARSLVLVTVPHPVFLSVSGSAFGTRLYRRTRLCRATGSAVVSGSASAPGSTRAPGTAGTGAQQTLDAWSAAAAWGTSWARWPSPIWHRPRFSVQHPWARVAGSLSGRRDLHAECVGWTLGAVCAASGVGSPGLGGRSSMSTVRGPSRCTSGAHHAEYR